ncbi:uncharacterized flagellar protein FlaG [Solibacillus silvestris StLB046]|uniref:Uncharacterized flagellar protein FlaG n=1 Tax=Solibacillus silvestris (strain StLB046) TaxID=1002809 RepID=F2F307_SOLSS|nr:flagellar protein FlaG [Solibacillus silvestris]BAK17695.1 uncharacterized flagellar protein FlaG [Solibacillus silvestris StLB046]
MRISVNSNIETAATNKVTNTNITIEKVLDKQGSEPKARKNLPEIESMMQIRSDEESKVKVQEVVNRMNEMLEVNNSISKFKYHEDLERYYVTVVNRDTEEVVKEIPPKKLLDAFYEMKKMLGMVVDEKI